MKNPSNAGLGIEIPECAEAHPNDQSVDETAVAVAVFTCLRAMIFISTYLSGGGNALHGSQIVQLNNHVEECRKCKRLMLSIIAEQHLDIVLPLPVVPGGGIEAQEEPLMVFSVAVDEPHQTQVARFVHHAPGAPGAAC